MPFRIRLVILVVVLLGGAFLVVPAARALSISPVKGVVTVEPGGASRVAVTITNTDPASAQFSLFGVALRQDSEGHTLRGAPGDEAAQWAVPDTNLFVLESGSKRTVFFTVTVPAGTSAGSRLVGLVARQQSLSEGGTAVTAELATVLSVQVAGIVTENLSFTATRLTPGITWKKNWQFQLDLKNTGSVELTLEGSAELRSFAGAVLAQEKIYLGNQLFPGVSRSLSQSITGQNIGYWPARYRVVSRVRYGKTGQEVFSENTIWYVPRTLLIWLSATLVLALSPALFLRRKKLP